MTPVAWNSLLHLKRSHFRYPDKLENAVVQALDRFINIIGIMPVVLSDVRPGDAGQHGLGTAIDTTWPRVDPVDLWEKARAARLFTGLGVYVNEQGVASFHFDTRKGDTARGYWIDRTVDNPALWGAFISHPFDTAQGKHVTKHEYVSAALVLDALKKKGPTAIILIALLLFALWPRPKRRHRQRP